MDALLNLLLSYLSGFTGVGGAAFAVSSGLAGLLTWFNIRKANQEAAETAEKRRQETEKRTSSVLTNLKDAGRFLTGEPSSQEKEIDNQLLNLEAEKDSLRHAIASFNSTLQLKHIEGVSPHYFQTRASISNAQSLLSIIKTHLLAIRESQEVLSYVGRLDENGRLVDKDELDPIAAERLEHVLSRVEEVTSSSFMVNESRILQELEERLERIRNETERLKGIVNSGSAGPGQTGTPSTRALPTAGSTPDVPGQLRLPLGGRSTSQQPARPAQQTRSQQTQRRRRGRT